MRMQFNRWPVWFHVGVLGLINNPELVAKSREIYSLAQVWRGAPPAEEVALLTYPPALLGKSERIHHRGTEGQRGEGRGLVEGKTKPTEEMGKEFNPVKNPRPRLGGEFSLSRAG